MPLLEKITAWITGLTRQDQKNTEEALSNREIYAKKGEIVTTENRNIPVYRVTEDIYIGEYVKASYFEGLNGYPSPKDGDLIEASIDGDYAVHPTQLSGAPSPEFHFKDGWR